MLAGVPGEEYDTVVVGGGSAGCALAGRLARDRRVLLLEAGPATWSPDLLDAATLAATDPGHAANWAHRVELRPGTATTIPRGRVLGGSGATNGAVWMRATPADGWGAPGWTWADMVARYARAEHDADLGDRPGDGPVPVSRPGGPRRHAVRTAAELPRAELGTRVEPAGDVLGSDRALDGWIAAHLGTAQHLCGTAPMAGPAAVVDTALRVHGVTGLRVADLSVLPTAPRRGTAATACAIGDAAAEFLGARTPGRDRAGWST